MGEGDRQVASQRPMSGSAGVSGGGAINEETGQVTSQDHPLDGPVEDQASTTLPTPPSVLPEAVGKAVSEWIPLLLGASPEDVVAALAKPPALTGETVAAVHHFLYSGKPPKERYGKDKDGRQRTGPRAMYHCLLAMDAELPEPSVLASDEMSGFARRVGKYFPPYQSSPRPTSSSTKVRVSLPPPRLLPASPPSSRLARRRRVRTSRRCCPSGCG